MGAGHTKGFSCGEARGKAPPHEIVSGGTGKPFVYPGDAGGGWGDTTARIERVSRLPCCEEESRVNQICYATLEKVFCGRIAGCEF